MDASSTPKRACPAYGSGDYAFRHRKTIAPEKDEPEQVETKYRCKACEHVWKERAPAADSSR